MMRNKNLIYCALSVVAALAAQTGVLTNESICEMVRSGATESSMIAAIENAETNFILDSQNLVRLHEQKVPGVVIRAMLRKGSAGSASPAATPVNAPPAIRTEVTAEDGSGSAVILTRRLQNATFVKTDKTDARAVIANLVLSDVGIALLTGGLSQQMKMWNPYMGDTLARATQLGRGLLAGSNSETRGFEYETLPGVAATTSVKPGKLRIRIPAIAGDAGQPPLAPVLLKLEPREKDGSRVIAARHVAIRQVKQGRFDMSPTIERQELAVQEAAVAADVERLPDGSLRISTKTDLAPGEYALVLRQPAASGAPTTNIALPISSVDAASLLNIRGQGVSRMAALGGFGRLGMLSRGGSTETQTGPTSAFIAWDFRVVE